MARTLKERLVEMFDWWGGTTWGTSFTTWRYGEFVGEDEYGNRYYRTRGGKIDRTIGRERRWVIFRDTAEATLVPPGWYGWLYDPKAKPPTEESYAPREWQKPHRPNLTGTKLAYRPPGSIVSDHPDAAVRETYDAWTPFSDEEPSRPPHVSPVDTRDGP